MSVYNESIYSIYSILNLSDVDNILISTVLFILSIKKYCNVEESLHFVQYVKNLI